MLFRELLEILDDSNAGQQMGKQKMVGWCDNQVKKGYRNESRSDPNESDPKDKMARKDLEKFKVYYLYQQGAPFFSVAQL